MPSTLLVTGGAAVVGAGLVRRLVERSDRRVVVDALTFAGNGYGRCPLRLVDEASA